MPLKLYAPGEAIPEDGFNDAATYTPALNPITNTLGKAFDTALDLGLAYLGNKVVGSTYPTGQLSPQQVEANKQATQTAAPFNWKPWAIGGGIFLALAVGAVALGRRK